MTKKRYIVSFVNRTTHDRKTFAVYEFNLLDASVAGAKLIREAEGDDWRRTWWEVGPEIDKWWKADRKVLNASRPRVRRRLPVQRAGSGGADEG